MTPRRDVIVHRHIFKNGGLSIDLSLKESFGPAWVTFERKGSTWTRSMNIQPAELLDHLDANPACRAVSSSTARWPVGGDGDLRLHTIVFIRHPIDRVASHYQHRRHAGCDQTADMTLSEYVDWALSDDGVFFVRSFQTLFLSGDSQLVCAPGEPMTTATAEHYRTAVARLEQLPAFGLLEKSDAAIDLLTKTLVPTFPGLVLRPHHVNWSGRSMQLGDRLHDIKQALGEDQYRRLTAANEADLDLYSRAESLFAALSGA